MNNNRSAWPLFAYTIPANETIYKGMNIDTYNTTYNNPSWFADNLDTGKQYESMYMKLRH